MDYNRLKKFMQVGADVKCMHTNFGGHGLSGFGDIATFRFGQFSLLMVAKCMHVHYKYMQEYITHLFDCWCRSTDPHSNW